jgi:hypothetical protein
VIFCNHRRFLKPSEEIRSWIEICYGSCSHPHPQIQLLQQLEQPKQVQGYGVEILRSQIMEQSKLLQRFGAEIPRPHPRTFEQPEQTQGCEGEKRQQDEVVQFKQSSGY